MDFEDFIVYLGLASFFVCLVFIVVILSTAIGLFVGWVISISPLNWWVEQGFLAIGLNVAGKITHIGAMLGFVSGFFSAYHYSRSKGNGE